MVSNQKLFDPAAVSTPAAGTLYTSPANVKTVIKKLTFYNGSGGALNLTVYLVPTGGAAGSGNIVAYHTLADKETYECYPAENQELNAGDFLSAASSGAGIVAQGAGLAIT
jgi:hypothetical protein